MATPTAPSEPEERVGASPLLIVAGTVLTVFLVTFLIYSVGDYEGDAGAGPGANLAGPAAKGACGQGTEADAGYDLDVVANPDPPRPEGTTFLMTLRHEGKPVTGARVCFTADMPTMEHPGLNYVAKESAGGRYEARIQFGMGGNWKTSVTIAEPNKPVVFVPLTIEVAPVEPA